MGSHPIEKGEDPVLRILGCEGVQDQKGNQSEEKESETRPSARCHT